MQLAVSCRAAETGRHHRTLNPLLLQAHGVPKEHQKCPTVRLGEGVTCGKPRGAWAVELQGYSGLLDGQSSTGQEWEEPRASSPASALLRLAPRAGGIFLHLLGGCRLLCDRA